MSNLLPQLFFLALDTNGAPGSGDKLNFYAKGTTERLDTYSDEPLTIAHTNPVVADAAGRFAPIWLAGSDYKVVWTDADDVTITTFPTVHGTIDVTGDDYAPSQQSTADMTVLLAAGSLFNTISKALVTNAAQTSAVITAPSSNPRIDIIYIDRLTGVVGVTTGSEAASPSDPTIPDDKLPVARVTLATTTTEITDSLIDDIRHLGNLGYPGFKDEDDFSSDSASHVASQQSIKAFINVGQRGKIDGLILSNDTDADHDIAIAAGVARDGGDAVNMVLSAVLTKQIDAAWAPGDDAGGLTPDSQIDGAETVTFTDNGGSDDYVTIDSGTWSITPSVNDTLIVTNGTNAGTYAITAATSTQIDVATASFTGDANSTSEIRHVRINNWYHVWLIRRSDTGVVDALFGRSATSPTLPTDYDQKRRIGAILTGATANILAFNQWDDRFFWETRVENVSDLTPSTSALNFTVTTPLGIVTTAIVSGLLQDTASNSIVINSPDDADVAPAAGNSDLFAIGSAGATQCEILRRTNTSSELRYRAADGTVNTAFKISTVGWIDPRGRNA